MLESLISNAYLRSAAILVATIAIAKIVLVMLTKYLKQITAKTKTTIDDELIDSAARPLDFLVLICGAYLALQTIPSFAPYLGWAQAIAYVIIMITLASVVSRTVGILLTHWMRVKSTYQKAPQVLQKGLAVVIYIIACLMILSHFQVEVSPLLATLGLGGLAVGLALQSTLSNLFSGLYIITDKPVRVGDLM